MADSIVFAPLGDSKTVTVTQAVQRFELPAVPPQMGAISLVSKSGTQTSYRFVLGSSTVVATAATAQRLKAGRFDDPRIIGVARNVTHISIYAEGSPSDVIITSGSTNPTSVVGGNVVDYNFKGTWASGTAYHNDELVYYGGSTYSAVANGTNHIPSSSPTYWSPFAAQGATGNTGPRGLTGNTGVPGTAATIAVANTITLVAGSSATVTNLGTNKIANFRFSIPRGQNGTSASVTVGSVANIDGGLPAVITNVGNTTNVILNFQLPAGDRKTTISTDNPSGGSNGDLWFKIIP